MLAELALFDALQQQLARVDRFVRQLDGQRDLFAVLALQCGHVLVVAHLLLELVVVLHVLHERHVVLLHVLRVAEQLEQHELLVPAQCRRAQEHLQHLEVVHRRLLRTALIRTRLRRGGHLVRVLHDLDELVPLLVLLELVRAERQQELLRVLIRYDRLPSLKQLYLGTRIQWLSLQIGMLDDSQ